MAFSFTTWIDRVFGQQWAYTAANLLAANIKAVKDSFEILHTFSSGYRKAGNVFTAKYKFTTAGSGNAALTSGALEVIDFDTKIFDEPGTDRVTTGAAWKFTADKDMKIRITAHVAIDLDNTFGAGENYDLYYRVDAGTYWMLTNLFFPAAYAGGASQMQISGSAVVNLASASYIQIIGVQDSGSDKTILELSGSAIVTYVDIEEI